MYLHRCGVICKFHFSKVIEEEQNAKPNPDGIRSLQNRKAVCCLPGDLSVDLLKKRRDIYVIVKGHNGKACAEKGGETHEDHLAPSENNIDAAFLLVSDDEGRLSNVGDVQVRFLLLDVLD